MSSRTPSQRDLTSLYRVPAGFEAEWPGSSAAATEVVLNVIRLGEMFDSQANKVVRRHGVPSTTGLMVMEVLRGNGIPMQPSEVAERCFLSRPGVTAVVDSLARRGLVRRETDGRDRRRLLLHLTPSGRGALERALPELHRAEATWVAVALTATQQRQLLRLIARLALKDTAETPVGTG